MNQKTIALFWRRGHSIRLPHGFIRCLALLCLFASSFAESASVLHREQGVSCPNAGASHKGHFFDTPILTAKCLNSIYVGYFGYLCYEEIDYAECKQRVYDECMRAATDAYFQNGGAGLLTGAATRLGGSVAVGGIAGAALGAAGAYLGQAFKCRFVDRMVRDGRAVCKQRFVANRDRYLLSRDLAAYAMLDFYSVFGLDANDNGRCDWCYEE